MSKVIQVHALWDQEAKVWVATSEDVPGLVCEADTAEQLESKLRTVIPELLIENGLLICDDHPEVPFHILAERDSVAIACQ